jgi:4-aminobutyrate aminotransferase-like enzyme/phosphatidylglycerophosphate synthase
VIDLVASLFLVAIACAGAIAWTALGRAHAPRYARVEQGGGSVFLGKTPQTAGYFVMQPVVNAFVRLSVSANALTIASVPLAAIAALQIALGHFGLAALFAMLSFACDLLDGPVARAAGVASDSGEILDATCDRICEGLLYGGLAIAWRGSVPLLALALAAAFGAEQVTLASAKADAYARDAARVLPRGAMRRVERAVYLVVGLLVSGLLEPVAAPDVVPAPIVLSVTIIALVANGSALSRFSALSRVLRKKAKIPSAIAQTVASLTPTRIVQKTDVPGPLSRELRRREDVHMADGLQSYAKTSGVAVDRASGSMLTDVDGNTFVDFIGGIGVAALGHSHPRVVDAISAQAARASVGSFTSPARVELVERVAAHAPAKGVHRLALYTSGAEAVESALRLAKCHTGKTELVSFWGGFHGKTLGAMSLMGSQSKARLGPFAPGSHQIPYADCYRCPLSLKHPSCGLACVEVGRKQLRAQSQGNIAAFIVEPMQGTAGNVIPPDDFLPAVRKLADEHDALLICDEMITGFGRTGKYWGSEHSGVRPDIVTLGKAFGGGFPLSGVLTTDEIAKAKPWSNPSGASSSYGGNPLAAAAGAAALRAIDEERLVDNAREMGAHMLSVLRAFEHPFIGAVRGRGLFLGVELVKDKKTKEPLSRAATERIYRECVKRGLLTMAYASSFRMQPALTIDRATANAGLMVLREVFDLAVREGFWSDS